MASSPPIPATALSPTHDPAIVERFARAIAAAGERARYIDSEHKVREWGNFGDASRSGRCFMPGRLADDLLALDADSAGLGKLLEGAISEMELDGLMPVVWASGRPGHRQLVARIADQQLLARWKRWARDHGFPKDGIRERWASARPPLSPHHKGLPVALVYPATVECALTRLERPPRSAHEPKRRIAPSTWRLLRQGAQAAEARRYIDPNTGKVDRSRMEFTITLGLIKCRTEGEIFDLLCDPRNRGGIRIQGLSERDARSYFEGTYRNALARWRPAFRDADDGIRLIETAAREARAIFSGRGGETRREMLLKLCEIARQRGVLTIGASVRDAGDGIGVRPSTAFKVFSAFQSLGVLSLATPADKRNRKAALWTLRLPMTWRGRAKVTIGNTPTRPLSYVDKTVSIGDLSRDVWRAHPGLGKTCGRVWQLLEGATENEIASARGVKVGAIRKQLNRLREVRLAFCDDAGRWHRTERELDDVARELGVYGAGTTQRQRHDEERDAYDFARRMRSAPIVDESTGEVVNAEQFEPPDDGAAFDGQCEGFDGAIDYPPEAMESQTVME
jgi:hypothetical protein